MAEDVIPADVQQFILHNIDSIAQLEGLLLLRANPQTQWTPEAVAKRLYIGEPEATALLVRLCAQGCLIATSKESVLYQYQPSSTELEHLVDRVADTYARYLVPVTHLIHAKPATRVQEFADAFKLRKE